MLEITVILTAAVVVYALARATRLPVIPMLIAVGVGLAAIGAMPDRDFVIGILEVGLAFLVFTAGMDMFPGRVGDKKRQALAVGFVQFGILGVTAAGLALLVFGTDYTLVEAFYIGLAVSASSTLVVVRLLKRRQESYASFGRMVIGVLLVQDALVIVGLVVLSATAAGGNPWMVVGTAGLLGVGAAVVGKWLGPWVTERLQDREEMLLLIVLALLFLFTGLAHLGGVPIVAGAFLAGLGLSDFPARPLVRGLTASLNDFFVMIFFIALGALVVIPSVEAVIQGLTLVVLVMVLTPLLVAFIAERAGMTARGALEAGLLLAQTSEFSLVVAVEGLRAGQIGDDLFAVIVLTTVVTMGLTPLFSSKENARFLMRFHPSPGPKKGVEDRKGHVVVVGAGRAGTMLVDRLGEARVPSVILDNDPAVVQRFREGPIDGVWGDGEDPRALKEAGVHQARAVAVTTGDLHHLRATMDLVEPEIEVWFHVFGEAAAERARKMGAETITYSEAGADALMDWYHSEMVER